MSGAIQQETDVDVLRSTDMFAGLDDRVLARLAASAVRRTYGRGQYLWYQGDDGDHLVVVACGLLKIVVSSEQGDEVVLATLGRREVIGELAMLDGCPRSASVVAVEPTTAMLLPRSIVIGLMREHPEVLDAVLRSLSRLVRRLTEQAGDFIFLDLGGRVAKLLLRLAEDHARSGSSLVIDLGLSQSELAAMVGASRPAVNRAIQVLAGRGLISVNGRAIELRDLPGLRRRAGY
jgi:CRP/FNR family cyclic AMP-dependent transcriptional regulator